MKVEFTIHEDGRCSGFCAGAGTSFPARSLTDAVVRGVDLAQTGELLRPSLVHDDAAVLEMDGLIKLKMQEFRTALFDLIKRQPTKVDGIVIRPSLKFTLELADSDSGKGCVCFHDAASLPEKTAEEKGKTALPEMPSLTPDTRPLTPDTKGGAL